MQHIKRGDFVGELNCELCITLIKAFLLSFEIDNLFIKLNYCIQILQLKRIKKNLLFSLSFSECSHLYLRKLTVTKYYLCTVSHMV